MGKRLLLVGCGEMGGALLEGFIKHQSALPSLETIHVICPREETVRKISDHVGWSKSPADLAPEQGFDVILFAVRPNVLPALLPLYRDFFKPNIACLSIAAGCTIEFFRQHLPEGTPIIRAMPNLPVAKSAGITLLHAADPLEKTQMDFITELFNAVGAAYWLQAETLFDAGTALGGCGPGFVYYFFECLAKSGVNHGLDPELSEAIARQLLKGVAAYLEGEPASFSELANRVAVAGGMTEAGLNQAKENTGLLSLTNAMFDAAIQRGKKIGG